MISIRDEQIIKFKNQSYDDFIDRCMALMRHQFPLSFGKAPNEMLSHFVSSGATLSMRLGFRLEPQIYTILMLSLRYGPELFRQQKAMACLTAADLNPEARLQALSALGYRLDPGEDDGSHRNSLLLYGISGQR